MKAGLIGCGSIGSYVAKALDDGAVEGMELAYLCDIDEKKAAALAGKLKKKPTAVPNVEEMLAGGADVIIEAASREAVKQNAVKILKHKISFVVMSVGAFADDKLLTQVKKTLKNGGRLYLPSGAIAGLDGIKSAAAGGIKKIELTTTKPVKALEDSKYLKEKGISLQGLKKPKTVFEGNAREAAKAFPKTINVSVALSLAGIGLEETGVRIIADPKAKVNAHEIKVEGESGGLTTKTTNTPMPGNPKTSYLAALSAVATLKNITSGIRVGN
jgi:aspartate dehydrogenase